MNKFYNKKVKKFFLMLSFIAVLTPILGMVITCKAYPLRTELEVATAKKLLPIYCVDTNGEKKVALTFDAAWGADDTDQLIATLDKYGVKATFFIVGDWVRKYPEEVKKLAAAGHDIANHSNKHPHMNSMNKEEIKKDIMAADEAIKAVTGKGSKLFRPPYGEYNDTVVAATKECGYYCVQWDVDSLDWKEYGLEPLITKVVDHKNLRPGSIILLHNNAKYTAEALDAIIKGILDKGFKIVPVSELLLPDSDYTIDFEGRQHSTVPVH